MNPKCLGEGCFGFFIFISIKKQTIFEVAIHQNEPTMQRKTTVFFSKLPNPIAIKFAGFFLLLAFVMQPFAQAFGNNDEKQDVELMTERGSIVLRLSDETPGHRDNFVKLVNEGQLDSLNFYRIIQGFLIQTGKDLPAGYPMLLDAEFRPGLFHKRGALNAAREGDDYNPMQGSAPLHFTIIQGKVFTDSSLNMAEQRINHGLAYHRVVTNSANKPLFLKLQALNREGANTDSVKAVLETLTQAELKIMKLYRIPEEHRTIYKTIGGTPHLDQNYTVFGEVVKGMEIVDEIAGVKTGEGDKPLKDVLILKAKMIKRN